MLVGLVAKLCLATLATPWTVAHQAPLSLGFFGQKYWSGLRFPSPGYLPDPGIKPGSPALQAYYLPNEPQENIIGLSLSGSLDEPQNLQITI